MDIRAKEHCFGHRIEQKDENGLEYGKQRQLVEMRFSPFEYDDDTKYDAQADIDGKHALKVLCCDPK